MTSHYHLPRILLLFTLLSFRFALSTAEDHWETLVHEKDEFKYLVPSQSLSNNWIDLYYDDQDWQSAIGGFGFGDNDDNTYVNVKTSLYLRKKFYIPSNIDVLQVVLDMDYDDAFVAYLNGKEIARSANLEVGTNTVTYDHEALMYQGGKPERYTINTDALVSGSNILAIQVFNISSTSSDFSARVFLSAQLEGTDIIYSETPDWFEVPVDFTKSNLPIVKINTNGGTIVDEPKIMANMQVIDNATGINYFEDTTYQYNSFCGIELRGFTSMSYDKKSYTVETRFEDGSNNNVPLLGLPQENDWVFHGPYSDKSLMRNALAQHIGAGMVKWTPRTRFVELIINDEYRGIYLVTEKIKIDKNRLDIATLKPTDITGDQLTGGYIISIDRDQEGSWNSPYMGRTGSVDVPFSYVDPKYEELQPEQREYIKEYIIAFETALIGSNFKDPELGYRAYIDVESFVDYFIITELSRDLDGYRVSVFFHKDKDSKNGKITMGPFWDYNLCFGNANFMEAFNTEGWAEEGIGRADAYEIPFWWDRFRQDPYFETVLKYRWEELRETIISKESITHFIDSCYHLLDDAQIRNFYKFDILSSYIWPNYYIGESYANEVAYLDTWVSDRIDWLDKQIEQITPSFVPDALANNTSSPFDITVSSPIPFDQYFDLDINLKQAASVRIEVNDLLGKSVYNYKLDAKYGNNTLRIYSRNLSTYSSTYIYTVYINNTPAKSELIIRK